jgi:hypothetical protein
VGHQPQLKENEMALSKKTRTRLERLRNALLDEAELNSLLPGGFNMSVGVEKRHCGTAGCIAGMAWVLAVGRKEAKEREDKAEIGNPPALYRSMVLLSALNWLGLRPTDDELPLFSVYAASAFRPARKITPEEAAEAIRIVLEAGNINYDPWAEMAAR